MESYYFCFKNEKVNEKKIMMLQKESCIVKSHDVYIDADYADWIAEVKHRYRSAQVKAAVKVNAEKLLFIGNLAVTWCRRRPKNVGALVWWNKLALI